MTPLLSPRHTWRLSLGEAPPPLPRQIDVVRVGIGLGWLAVDKLRDLGKQLGPLCIAGSNLFLLVPAGTADWWHAPHSVCERGPWRRWAQQDGVARHHLVWVLSPEAASVTDPEALYERLSLVRSRMRTAADCRQVREECHV